jgi:hypothetical protein
MPCEDAHGIITATGNQLLSIWRESDGKHWCGVRPDASDQTSARDIPQVNILVITGRSNLATIG